MNKELDFIFTRRSVRQYKADPVSQEILMDLLEAGMSAPSAVAKDPWHFIVLQSRKTLDDITSVLPSGQMLKQATAGIIVCGDIEKVHDKQESFMLQDLSAAVENILLAANVLGVGSCWIGIHPRADRMEGVRNFFQLPPNIIPMCGVALGYAAEKPPARTRFSADKVHMEKW